MTRRLAGLDSVRYAAALAVFGCHVVAYWPQLHLPHHAVSLSQVGAHGVDVFVVLSGFSLMIPLVGRDARLDVRQFWLRRAGRILPPYWVALTAAVILAVSPLWHYTVARRATALDVLTHVLGLQTWFPSTLGSINGSLWSVSVELALYAVFPVLVLIAARTGQLVLSVGAMAVCLTWSMLSHAFPAALGGLFASGATMPNHLVQFTLGMALAQILLPRLREQGSPAAGVTAVLCAGGLTLIAVALSTIDASDWMVVLAWGITGAALISGALVALRGRAVVVLDRLGKRSFSFYLVHQPIILLLDPVVRRAPGPWYVVLGLGALLALAAVTLAAEVLYRLVELPSHRASRARFGHQVVPVESAAAP